MTSTPGTTRLAHVQRELAVSRTKAGNATGRLVGMVHELRQAHAEIERLRALLAEHGIEDSDA